jgi:hypothetical protein
MSWRTMFVTLAIATTTFMAVLGLHSPKIGYIHCRWVPQHMEGNALVDG